MTPAEFRALRETRYVKRLVMAFELGITEEAISRYERGVTSVPQRLEERLLHGVGGPCPRCRRTITTAWHDGLCGGCSALVLPEASDHAR